MSILVLGIDAAWTPHHPSGVALVRVASRQKPRLLAVGRSYEEFSQLKTLARLQWQAGVTGASPDLKKLLHTSERLAGARPHLITLDIPLSNKRFFGRRVGDNLLTSAYVARGAGTHTPSEVRPGAISRKIFHQLCRAGYFWLREAASDLLNANSCCFAETYPHPAIIELMQLPKRLAYKTSRASLYWPDLKPAQRGLLLCRNLEKLRRALAQEIAGVDRLLPSAYWVLRHGRREQLKGFEDALDAVVCAWVGVQIWRGHAKAFGDRNGAIWVPKPVRE